MDKIQILMIVLVTLTANESHSIFKIKRNFDTNVIYDEKLFGSPQLKSSQAFLYQYLKLELNSLHEKVLLEMDRQELLNGDSNEIMLEESRRATLFDEYLVENEIDMRSLLIDNFSLELMLQNI
jgi:hypothetical protein